MSRCRLPNSHQAFREDLASKHTPDSIAGPLGITVGLILLMGTLLGTTGPAFAEQTIEWQHPDFPPSYILQGPYRGQGSVDNIHRQLFTHLVDYKHKTIVANFRRVIRSIAAKREICAAAILWNKERAEMVEYSIPHFLVHPVRIIIRKDIRDRFEPYKESDGTYSLERILMAEELMLGYAPGRSYSKTLDQILKPYTNDNNSRVVAQNSILSGILKMLERNRIDYTLGYSHEVAYLANTGDFRADFISLPIKGANELIPVHVGCPKNEWGRAIISKLNRFIPKVRSTESFYGAYLQWLDPATQEEYKKSVKKIFSTK